MSEVEFQHGFSSVRIATTSQVAVSSRSAIWLSSGIGGDKWHMLPWRLANVLELMFLDRGRVWWNSCRNWLALTDISRANKAAELLAIPWRLFRYIVLGKSSGILRHVYDQRAEDMKHA